MSVSSEARRCPACGATSDAPASFEAEVPVLLNVVLRDREEARAAPRGRLALHECLACGLVWNAAFAGVAYDATYVVDASRSPRYRRHLDDVSDRVVRAAPARDGLVVVEIGAGQGGFLSLLVTRHGARIERALGVDPAFRVASSNLPERVDVLPWTLEDLPASEVPSRVDVVVARHVVEHVADPVAFLRVVARTFGAAGPFSLVVETPNVEHTLARGLLHDFCYEHCSMLGPTSLVAALERAGFVDVDVDAAAFDGEYLVATARLERDRGRAATPPPRTRAPRLAPLASSFVPAHARRIARSLARGPVVAWGAAGKGALFGWLVDPDATHITAYVDLLEAKHGSYLPGTGHRVVAPDASELASARTVIVSNPTYGEEIRDRCARMGLVADVWCVGDADDESPSSGARDVPRVG